MTNNPTAKAKGISPVLMTYLLIIIGLLFISVSSLSEAQSTFGDKYYFIRKQLIWVSAGTIVLFLCSKIKLDWLKKLAPALFFASIFFLVIVLIPGLGNHALGATRWINIGFLSFQPSETFKLVAIIYFSFLFTNQSKRNLKTLLYSLGPALFLIILEPNLSTTVLIASIVLTIYYLSGGEIISLLALCSAGLLLSLGLILISPYRYARLSTLLNPQKDITKTSYHSNQIIISLASGGLFGKGFANSSQKYQFVPQLTTDSILAIIGEEMGFVGLVFILILYLILIYSIFRVARQTSDPSYQLIVCGIAAWISFQSLINVSAIASIIPLTGVPLPFISYGGSSLLMLLSAIGIVHNIDKNVTQTKTATQ